jgi:hypothetical protein
MKQTMTVTRLEQVPEALTALFARLSAIEAKIVPPTVDEKKEWLTIDDLIEYLPSHPAKATIYGLVHRKAIPSIKINSKLIFVRAEIDEWLKSRKNLSYQELNDKATAFIRSRKK